MTASALRDVDGVVVEDSRRGRASRGCEGGRRSRVVLSVLSLAPDWE